MFYLISLEQFPSVHDINLAISITVKTGEQFRAVRRGQVAAIEEKYYMIVNNKANDSIIVCGWD